MKLEKRSIATCIILSILTCGIYEIYWIVKMGKEAVSVKDENDDGLLEILLMIFLPCAGLYLAEKKLSEGASAKGVTLSDNAVLYLVLGLFGFAIVGFALMQNDLNKLADIMTPPPGGYYTDPNNQPPAGGYYDATNTDL